MAKNPQNDFNENKSLENSENLDEKKIIENSNELNNEEITTDNIESNDNKIVEDNNTNNTEKNYQQEENCKCCNSGCKCGDCKNCADCSVNKNCCSKKCSIVLAIMACILSVFSVNKVNKICKAKVNNNIEDRIKTEVKEVIIKNPQLILDAISNGLVNKRDNMLEQSAINVENNKSEVIKSAIRVGELNTKFTTICFFDPAGSPCKEALKSIVDILNDSKSSKKMCFYLLPVSILGDNSEELAKVYYQLQAFDNDKSKKAKDKTNKLGEFIQEIVKEGATIDKALDKIKVNKNDLKKYEEIAKSNLYKNNELLEKLKISSLPAIFVSNNHNPNNKKYEIITKSSLLSNLI
ncbi:MAG: hypothetical protein IJ848_01870 [Alphaproteobacteria bacterium]|nr:hypothetical protein [Alphaproteobacteria bacterium]